MKHSYNETGCIIYRKRDYMIWKEKQLKKQLKWKKKSVKGRKIAFRKKVCNTVAVFISLSMPSAPVHEREVHGWKNILHSKVRRRK